MYHNQKHHTMKEELISLETARLAKEKGFDIGVFGVLTHYVKKRVHHEDGASGPFGWEKDEVTFDKSYIVNGNEELGDFSNDNYKQYARPSQSFLQKWLRENHKEHIRVSYIPDRMCFSSSLTMRSMGWSEFKTYEDALEKALQEALKLI